KRWSGDWSSALCSSDLPAPGELVVDHCPVTVVIRLAAAAEAAPQGVRRRRSVDQRARLRVDADRGVDDLEVVARADGAVRVGRQIGRAAGREEGRTGGG